ncbi:unnamed protein product [Lota lota]
MLRAGGARLRTIRAALACAAAVGRSSASRRMRCLGRRVTWGPTRPTAGPGETRVILSLSPLLTPRGPPNPGLEPSTPGRPSALGDADDDFLWSGALGPDRVVDATLGAGDSSGFQTPVNFDPRLIRRPLEARPIRSQHCLTF